jgi:hypothetical protein
VAGRFPDRSIDNIDSEQVLSYTEVKAIATGNPLILGDDPPCRVRGQRMGAGALRWCGRVLNARSETAGCLLAHGSLQKVSVLRESASRPRCGADRSQRRSCSGRPAHPCAWGQLTPTESASPRAHG